jgi:hypothetical protein
LGAFFDNGWAERFARYDAAYLRSDTVIADEVRRAVHELLRQRGTP